MMVGSSCTDDRLPPINWQNQSIKILGFQIGNVIPRAIWHDSLEGLRKSAYNIPFQTCVTGQIQTPPTYYLQCTYSSTGHDLKKINKKRIFKLLDKQSNDQSVHEELTETDK